MTLAIIQARMSSTRFPGKVLKDFGGEFGPSILHHVYMAVELANSIDKVVVATSTDESDDAIVNYCIERGWEVFRGSLHDVLDRFYHCAEVYRAETIVRITADCPLIPTAEIERVLDAYNSGVGEFVSNRPEAPDGWDCEVFSFRALEETWRTAVGDAREHVTMAMKLNRNFYPQRLAPPMLSVNYPEDLGRVEKYL